MVFFNDPVPCDDAPARAVRMAVAMRGRVQDLADGWRKRGHDLGFGVGIAQGYATLGRIGFEGRFDYAAIGSVTNLAARLAGAAGRGQILVTQRVQSAVADVAVTDRARADGAARDHPTGRGVRRHRPRRGAAGAVMQPTASARRPRPSRSADERPTTGCRPGCRKSGGPCD